MPYSHGVPQDNSLFAYALTRQRETRRSVISPEASLRISLNVDEDRWHPDFSDRVVRGSKEGEPCALTDCVMRTYPEMAPRPVSVHAPAEVVVMAWRCGGQGPFAYPLTMN